MVGQYGQRRFLIQIIPPQVRQRGFARLAFGRRRRPAEYLSELLADGFDMADQFQGERTPARLAHGERQPQFRPFIVRQVVGLLIGPGLQAVLDPAQKVVGLLEAVHCGFRHSAAGGQMIQHPQDAALAQRRIAPAVDELERLANEFDLADATWPQLDVAPHPLAFHLLGDQGLHVAQGFERAVIQIAAVDEGPQPVQQSFPRRPVAGDDPRLDHGVAFPVTAMILVVILEGGERNRQRPGIAEWAQTHVHPVHKPFGGRFGQRLDQPLAQPAEEFLVADRLSSVGLALAGIGEDQINIRREVEFAPAELAHSDHDQPLQRTFGIVGFAETPDLPAVQPLQRRADQGFRQIGQIAQRLFQSGQSGQIAPGDAYHLSTAEPAQRHAKPVFIGGFCERLFQPARVTIRRVAGSQIAAGEQIGQQRRLADAGAGDELAAGPNCDQLFQHCAGGRIDVRLARRSREGFPMSGHIGLQRFGQPVQTFFE